MEESESFNEDVDYEVEKIISYRNKNGIRQYYISWKGYGQEMDSWENESCLNCDLLIREFWKGNPRKMVPDDACIENLYVSNGKYFYLIRTGHTMELMTSQEAQIYYPQLVVAYLETLSLKSQPVPSAKKRSKTMKSRQQSTPSRKKK